MYYRFAEFELDAEAGTLTGPEGQVSLRKQTCRLLQVLLDHAPEVLDRNELLDEAWGRTALSPNVVPQAISELRQALGDKPNAPRCIETRHRRGYRIICPVEKFEVPPLDDEPSATPEAGHHSPTRFRLLAGGVAVALTALAVVSTVWWQQGTDRRWLDGEALPEIRQLVETDLVAAWQRLREARARLPENPVLEQMWLDITLPSDLVSEPPGALIEVRGYRDNDTAWVDLGLTPLKGIRLPLAQLRFRLSLDGFQTLEAAPNMLPAAEPFRLYRPVDIPGEMVRVPPGRVTYLGRTEALPEFWIDRHEVTNREYRSFIEAGGYQQPKLWRYAARLEGRDLSHEELLARFTDTTGMPGPATWALGTFPEGEGDKPVEGISWYEAAAYAEHAGKLLPTVYHWYRAAGLGTLPLSNFSGVLYMSNFGGRETTPVGALNGLGPYGTLDMAGNVTEWTVNPAGELRHILGGSWQSNNYRFIDPDAQHPLDRRPGFGLRLMRQANAIEPALKHNVSKPSVSVPEPVDDATFAIYARQFNYDPIPLEATIDGIDDRHRDWRRERVSFAAAYGNERVIVQLFLPRKGKPPYQAVVHFPGGDALMLNSSLDAGLNQVELFLRSGRAVVYPVFAGTFERGGRRPTGPVSHRDLIIAQIRDLRRTVDYLETRSDIDHGRLMLHALSYGGWRAPFALALDDRLKAAIILSAGIVPNEGHLPEVQLQNYLPRVTQPVLLITGRDDFGFPLESSQKPFYKLLGTTPDRKRHRVFEWGHIPPHDPDLIRAHLDWTDRWLGPASGN